MGEPSAREPGVGNRRSIRVSSRSGRIQVVAEERQTILVEKAGRRIALDESEQATVSSRSSPLTLRVPEGIDLVIGTVSGRVSLQGRAGRVAVTTMSGRIWIEEAESVDARTVSSRVEVGCCEGDVRVDTVSGRASVGRAGAASLSTMSGRISVGEASGPVRVRSVSGRVSVEIGGGEIDVNVGTVSGRIELRIPAGVRPRQQLESRSGRISSSVPQGEDGQISARAVSGSVSVTGAA